MENKKIYIATFTPVYDTYPHITSGKKEVMVSENVVSLQNNLIDNADINHLRIYELDAKCIFGEKE